MAPKIDSIYKSILNDARVRAAVDKITRHFPSAPFMAIVIGTGAASEPATFVLIPLLKLVPGVAAASSLVSLTKSAVSGKPVPPGSIFTLLQSVVATGLGVPTFVVGTMMDGTVRAVKMVQEKAEGKRAGELKAISGEGSVGGDGEACGGESSKPVVEGADVVESASTEGKGDEQGNVNDAPLAEHASNVVAGLASGVSEGVAKTGEVLDSTWTVAKTVLFEKYSPIRPKL